MSFPIWVSPFLISLDSSPPPLFWLLLLSFLPFSLYLSLSLSLEGRRRMMKKGRMVVMESSPSSSLPLGGGGGGEARARSKHHALLQDYEELLRETEAKKRKLQKTMEKQQRLAAEVRFLQKKYESFTRNPSGEKPIRLKKLPRKLPSPSVWFTQPSNAINNGNLPLQQERNLRMKETNAPSSSSVLFDLNKVSFPNAEEMEGIQAEWEPLKVEKLKRCSVDREAVAQDLNLSIFKDVGAGSSHVGKRKITWQDQVALRV